MGEADGGKPDFGQAALEHMDALYGFAMALTRDQTEAEDLVQETYLRASKALNQLPPDSNLKGWLFTILRNIWINQLRHARRGPQFVELDEEAEEQSSHQLPNEVTGDPHALLIRKLERAEVRAALDRLPRQYREVIVLRDLEGFSYHQIATIIGCPAGTVMSRLGRAREKLRLLLSRWQAEAAAEK
jgi:RNA polymerase sigma-70 factor (ECF subfamily)